ncbi:MAG: hypothetical protein Q9165_006883, partial [Trypethelium subeluteriae]
MSFFALAVALLVMGAIAAPKPKQSMPPLPNSVTADLNKMNATAYKTFNIRDPSNQDLPPDLTGIQDRCFTTHCLVYTFDDGPSDLMRKVVDQAVQGGFKVTFMVNVNNHFCIYDEKRVADLRYAQSKGMEFCSHTATHPHLDKLTNAQIDKQIEAVDTALWKILGVVPSCIRPPFGEASSEVVQYINQHHRKIVVNWDLDTEDSMGASVATSEKRLQYVESPTRAIILMHETIDTSPNQLFPDAIKMAKSHGYTPADMQTVSKGL